MKIDLGNSEQVASLIAELRDGLTLIICDAEVADLSRARGHLSLWAAADNVIDARDGKVTFLKRRNE